MEAPVRVRADRSTDERDFADLWLILWHRRVSIAAITAACVALVLAYCLATPRLYTSAAQILVDPRSRQVLASGVTPDGLAADGGLTQVESQVRVLQSDVVLTRAVQIANLATDDEFSGNQDGLLSGTLRALRTLVGRGGGAEDANARAVRLLKRRLTVKRADKVFVIDIAVSTEDADKSARVANAVAQAYLLDQSQARAAIANTASTELTSKLADLEAQVRSADTAVEAYKSARGIVGSSGRLVKEQQLTDTNNQLVAAQTRLLEARARQDAIEAARRAGPRGSATTDALQSPNMLQLQQQYALVTRQKADLDAQLGRRHPAIAAIDAQVADIRRLMAGEIARIAQVARTDVQQADVTTRGIQRQVEDLSRSAQATGLDAVRLRELERQADATRVVYEAFLRRARETAEEAGINTVNARIISPAVPPVDGSWPPTILLLLGALGGGLGLGCANAFLRAHLDPVVLSRGHVRALSDLPVIAVGPAPSLLSSEAAASARLAHTSAQALAPLRTLLARHRTADRPAVLLFGADADNAVLKTRLVQALAASVALGGSRVLLVDGDFGKRRLSVATERGRGPGLLDVVRGRRALEQATGEDAETGVTILGAGIGDSIVRPLTAPVLQTWLAGVARRFDCVIIDGGDVAADVRAASLCQIADAHLAIVRPGTSGLALRDLTDGAQAVGHPFSGLVYVHADRGA